MRRLRSVAVPVAVCLLLLAVAAAATAASPTPGASPGAGRDVYRIGTTAAYDGLNPFTARGGLSRECLSLCYDSLTGYVADPAGGYDSTPDLASAWKPSDQGRVWTFTIRSGMTWQDGVPLTADDVVFTYGWIRATGERTYARYLAGVSDVRAPDATTLIVACREPNATVPVIPIPILPAHVWRSYAYRGLAAAKAFANLPPVGSGPFRVVRAASGVVELAPDSHYPAALGGPPHLRRLLFVQFTDAAAMVRSYEAGGLDATVGWPAADEAALRRVPGTAVSRASGLGAQGLLFDCRPGVRTAAARLLRRVTVRQAIAWAIDRPAVAAAATGGLAVPGSSLLSPALGDWHWDVPAGAAYRFQPGHGAATAGRRRPARPRRRRRARGAGRHQAGVPPRGAARAAAGPHRRAHGGGLVRRGGHQTGAAARRRRRPGAAPARRRGLRHRPRQASTARWTRAYSSAPSPHTARRV